MLIMSMISTDPRKRLSISFQAFDDITYLHTTCLISPALSEEVYLIHCEGAREISSASIIEGENDTHVARTQRVLEICSHI